MPGEKHGEAIVLVEVDDYGGRFEADAYVRGHVDDATFRAAIAATYDEDEDVPEYGPVRHVWARWEFCGGTDDYGTHRRTLAEHRKPGRGLFAVTAATDASIFRRREQDRQQEESDVGELLALYPGCEATYRNGYGRNYTLRTPGENGISVRFDWCPLRCRWRAWARGMDVPAWDVYLDSIRGGDDAL
jgi:hypothetical protein